MSRKNRTNAENRKWDYAIEDSSSINFRFYIIIAQRREDEETWIEINHDGEVAESVSLGGDGVRLVRHPI